MTARTILPLLAVAFLLASCGASPASLDPQKIDLRGPGVEALRPCEPPQPGERIVAASTAGEQGALWEADRVALANCGYQHGVLIRWARGVVEAFAVP